MNLRILTEEELKTAYETDLQEAFPPTELKPLFAMEDLRRKGLYDPLALYDEAGELMGYALLWRHCDGRYILIDYLCVPARRRNGGIGARLLSAIRAHYPAETVFLAESEAPVGDGTEDAMILRRLGFYQRNGGVILGYDCALFGVHFKNICWAESLPAEEEILQKHREIYLHQFGQARYDQFIQIPLLPGEKLFALTDWTEDQ